MNSTLSFSSARQAANKRNQHDIDRAKQFHNIVCLQMESVIKQGQEALWLAESRSVGLCKEYEPLKSEVNCLREEAGLEAVDEDPALEPSSLAQLASRYSMLSRRGRAQALRLRMSHYTYIL